MDVDITKAALACARSVFGDVGLVAWTPLTSSERSVVARMALLTDAGARTVIVKSNSAGARERAALQVLADAKVDGVPRLLAVHDDPPLILLEDAGDGVSLADRLRGSDRAAAARAVEAWAERVAEVQVATLNAGAAFGERLASLDGEAMTDNTPALMDEAVADFARFLPEIGASISDAAADEFHAIGDRLRVDLDAIRGPGALTPGDTCPDNNIETSNFETSNIETSSGLTLIDFEFAEFRHVAWDAAYLVVPWPTCWCCWRMPPDVTAAAMARWRSTVIPALDPAVAANLDDAVRDATIGWSLMTASWFLPRALGHEETTPNPRRPRPESAVLVQHRLDVAVSNAPDGPLRTFAAEALAATRRAFGDQPLALGSVWR